MALDGGSLEGAITESATRRAHRTHAAGAGILGRQGERGTENYSLQLSLLLQMGMLSQAAVIERRITSAGRTAVKISYISYYVD